MVSKLGKRAKISIVLKESSLLYKEDHDLKVEPEAVAVEVSNKFFVCHVKAYYWNLFAYDRLLTTLLCDLVWIRND